MQDTGIRHRKLSIHQVEVLQLFTETTPTMGTKKTWKATGRLLPCRVIPLSADAQTALLAPAIRTTYRLRFADDPALDGRVNRVRIIKPLTMAGRVLRLEGDVIDAHGMGRSFLVLASQHSEDQQTPVT
jgi:hypothetical protein